MPQSYAKDWWALFRKHLRSQRGRCLGVVSITPAIAEEAGIGFKAVDPEYSLQDCSALCEIHTRDCTIFSDGDTRVSCSKCGLYDGDTDFDWCTLPMASRSILAGITKSVGCDRQCGHG